MDEQPSYIPCRYNPLLGQVKVTDLPPGELLDLLITLADLNREALIQVEAHLERAAVANSTVNAVLQMPND